MIIKGAATEALSSDVSYHNSLSRGHLTTGIVDLSQYDFIINKYLSVLSLFTNKF